MKVLLTGATGFLGGWIARELAAAGHAVRALVRASSKLDNLDGLPVERAEGDVLDEASVVRALQGCEAVVHTAGIAHFNPDSREHMYAVNVRGVEIVLGAALRAGVRRAVLTSSVAAMGGSPLPRVADEHTPSNAEELGIHYMISKLHGERAALRLGTQGLPVCVLRPAVLLGPGDIYRSSATTILALARRELPVYVPGGASFCDVRDVARAHAVALERGTPGEVYIVGGHNLKIGELVQAVSRRAGVQPPRQVSYAVALAVATAVEVGGRLLGRPVKLSRQLVRSSHLYTWVSSARAARELGYTVRPLEESIDETLRFFLKRGRLRPTTPELYRLMGS
ncbi:MAG: NAD-dependent epimerase/dehydratase family protein [Myxococcales bacterium]|nr:NAD-dependent epimerase/dehydratase family protein [Myxococcota bacterium]MDW8283924.1 NAD-dependent epimerase/dehydratase family protein [Myxococcales bacterium]